MMRCRVSQDLFHVSAKALASCASARMLSLLRVHCRQHVTVTEGRKLLDLSGHVSNLLLLLHVAKVFVLLLV